MMKNTDMDKITREVYIEKLHGVAAEYARLFIENPQFKEDQKVLEDFQKIGAMIRNLRFDKEIPDEKCLEAVIKEAEMKLPVSEEPIAYWALTKKQFDAER